MWEVYIIESINFSRHYIGYSQNAEFRLVNYHNQGRCKATKHYAPYRIIRIEKYDTKTEALKREKQIKKMKGGVEFKKLLAQGGRTPALAGEKSLCPARRGSHPRCLKS